ncbi:MAG: LLM class flavin-dependent oxidoreductase, partial [Candidatus Xenobia bacterium]
NLEGWQILPAWAAITKRLRLGALVTGNTYRHPAVLANMSATLDHISEGRAILGMGAAWYELEHQEYGIDFGKSPGERLARLGEALPIVRSLLDNRTTTFEGKYYHLQDAMCEPKPVQSHLPIMVGGGGEQKTLRLVARYADYWNGFGAPEEVGRKLDILRSHCQEAGTDFNRIVTTVLLRVCIGDGQSRQREFEETNRLSPQARAGMPLVSGSVEEIAGLFRSYHEIGIKGIIVGMPAPYDRTTLELLQKEVKPRLLAAART